MVRWHLLWMRSRVFSDQPAATAIAGELSGFVWAIARQVTVPTG